MKKLDALVIGAGLTGLYAIYKLRELGLEVEAVEKGTGVGGTWYWNRYPGARTDSQSYVYQYWFSDELLQEWDWSETFPAQEETERYLNHVADKFDLRAHINFKTEIASAEYDEGAERWLVTSTAGEQYDVQFLLACTGILTEPVYPNIPGREKFKGVCYHTSRWPSESVNFANQRVGIVGTGATGIQVIQTIAPEVGHMTVFQRTPNYTIAINNPELTDEDRAAIRERYPDLKERVKHTFAGFHYDAADKPWAEVAPEQRTAFLEELWADGSLKFWVGGFAEVFFDEQINEELSNFVRAKIRGRIDDPALADKLVPTEYGFGTRRVPLENRYYEAFNQPNVNLVDVNETPIEEITETGVRTAAGEIELDMLIFATGFDAGTGALSSIEIQGRGRKVLGDEWRGGVRSYLGMQVHGFPNLFMAIAPQSPAASFCNVPTCSQQQIDWMTDAIAFLRNEKRKTIEPSADAEASWVAHHHEIANQTLVVKTKSWYVGANIEGKANELLAYIGGVGAYRQKCDEVKAQGYKEFEIA
ncbi:MAG: NAD(P)/FAD-dependent oxidoreductase [Pseudomonadota bacterium]